jgi:hypothetical protein
MKAPSNMRELLQWFENKKKARKPHHIEMLKIYGECKGMGNRRYKLPQKKVFRKRFYVLNTN